MLTSKSKSPKGVLDVGEILSASDEETERPKVEPCSLAFCVSHVAGRVHVLDAAEQPMGFNFKLADWQAFQNGSALLPGLVSDPETARCTETFLRSWCSLRPLDSQKFLVSEGGSMLLTYHSPLPVPLRVGGSF